MSNFYYGPALDSELDYRREILREDAAAYRLARQARRAGRTTRTARHPFHGVPRPFARVA